MENIETRTDILNFLIDTFGYKRYLEIGVQDPGNNFDKIRAVEKFGVDPAGNCKYAMTSDQFFSKNKEKWDLVFVDGWHSAGQVRNDVNNALKVLEDNGTVVCHDSLPPTFEAQANPYLNGDCWLAIAELRMTRSDLLVGVVDIDQGCAFIRRGQQTLFSFPDGKARLNYDRYVVHKKALMNTLSVEAFREAILSLRPTMI